MFAVIVCSLPLQQTTGPTVDIPPQGFMLCVVSCATLSLLPIFLFIGVNRRVGSEMIVNYDLRMNYKA